MGYLRPVRTEDLDAILGLAKRAGSGLTTLPPNREALARRIEKSLESFAKPVKEPGEEYYLYSLVEPQSKEVIGTSGIYAQVGISQPFYNYRMLHLTQVSHVPETKVDTTLLQLVNDYAGASEMATLFLNPDHRAGGYGSLLSRSRYLMMAGHPERFSHRVMAEIRGWVDDAGRSPFWEAIGRHFFGMNFMEADRINGLGNQQFIGDLMPKFPIYATLLPPEAQAVIGKPHDNAQGAVRMLENEGFRFAGAIDIFDGGPCLEAPRDQIWSVRHSRILPAKIGDVSDATNHIIGSPDIQWARMTRAPVQIRDDHVVLNEETARLLNCGSGDPVLIAPPAPRR